jgi:hypothetical protein
MELVPDGVTPRTPPGDGINGSVISHRPSGADSAAVLMSTKGDHPADPPTHEQPEPVSKPQVRIRWGIDALLLSAEMWSD